MNVAPIALFVLMIGAGLILVQRANAATAKGFMMTASRNPTVTSPDGIAFIKRREGFSATAYPDGKASDGRQLYSIGYGHQIISGDGLTQYSVITEKQASDIFLRDLASREKLIRDYVRVPITQPMFDALASIAYNIGNAAFINSTLLKKLNAGDYGGALNEFMVWTKSGTQNVERRQQEAVIFGSGMQA